MKPRNKFEKAVLAQSDKLHPLSKTQLSWAFRECVSHFAHRLPKGRTTCMDCGHEWVKKKSDRALCLSEMPRKTEGQEYPCPQSEAEELFHRACQVWGVSDLANVSACGGNGERLQGSPLRLGNRAILVERQRQTNACSHSAHIGSVFG